MLALSIIFAISIHFVIIPNLYSSFAVNPRAYISSLAAILQLCYLKSPTVEGCILA